MRKPELSGSSASARVIASAASCVIISMSLGCPPEAG
jgi:hypothetical protein